VKNNGPTDRDPDLLTTDKNPPYIADVNTCRMVDNFKKELDENSPECFNKIF
jgi:hypothetical protein